MRVIAGTARGRPLRAPSSPTVRPTSDRVREAIFDVLTSLSAVEDSSVLDLFAGSGALGIEALSRGAASAVFVDSDRVAEHAILANLASTGLSEPGRTTVVRSDALRFLRRQPREYDLAFLDPPYRFSEWEELLGVLRATRCVIETSRPIELPPSYNLHRTYRYGTTLVSVATRLDGGPTASRETMTSALFPGSFDPFHNGHLEVVERAQRLFDRVTIAVLRNSDKADPLFSPEEREQMITESVSAFSNVDVVSMATLAVNIARDVGANVIIRGLRAVSDFELELQMSQMNHQLSGIETLFIPTGSAYSFISSRLIREVAGYGGDVAPFVPASVQQAIVERAQ